MDRTIGECFYQIQNGANIKQGNANGGYPITRIETIANDKFNRDRMGYAGINDISKYESYILEDGDLLMSHINSVQYLGRTVLYEKMEEETIIHGMNLLRLKARSDIINPAYARYCFYGHLFRSQIANITKKSVNQASFAIQDLKQIKIDVPEVGLQKQIVEILNKISWIIEKRKQELNTFDELIRARFVEMFGNPVRNSKNWNTEKLCSIAPINKYNGDIDTVNGKVWLLNLDMIESCTGNIVDFLYEFENRITSSTIKFDENCVLYSKLRPYLNKVVIPERKGYATSELVSMSTEKINKYFLANLLRQDSFVNFSNATAYGAKMPRASMDLIKNFDVINPPTELQNQFGKLVIEVEKSKLLAASQPQIHIYKTLTLL